MKISMHYEVRGKFPARISTPTSTHDAVGKRIESLVPAYHMLEDIKSNYLESYMKTITFNDYYQFSLKEVGSGKTFNHLVSKGIYNL